MADGVAVQYVVPLSFIKNAVVLSIVYVVVTNGLGYVWNIVQARGPLPALGMVLGGTSLLSVVIGGVAAALGACLTVVIFNWVAGRGNGFPLRFHAPAPWTSGSRELKRISPVPAMLTGAVGGLIGGFLLGACYLVLVATFSAALGGGGLSGQEAAAVG
jgi:hypothetical protein